MSYSALILKDSPEVFWDLNMNTGTTVKSDPFVSDSAYNGTAFTFSRSAVPITYGGIACIQNNGSYTENYSSNNKIFSIPSLGKFSSSTRGNFYSLEFWMNLSIPTKSLSSGPTSRLGESKIVGVSGNSLSGLYVRDLDYLVFKIGDSGFKVFESSVHVREWNTPLHVLVVYDAGSIQLFVNGVAGSKTTITEEIFGAAQTRTIDFLFPDRMNSSSPYFDNISYDTVAIYAQALGSSVAKRHYVYGLGYDVPKYLIKSAGGVSYETNLQLTAPIKQINYLDYNTWSNSISLNNLLSNNDGLSTLNFNNQSLVLSSDDSQLQEENMISSSGYVVFPSNGYTYLEVADHESITLGETKKIEAKFKLLSGHSTTEEQQLMYIGSKSLNTKYISVLIVNKTVTVKYKEENGSETTLLTQEIGSSSSDFFVSLAKNGKDVSIRVNDSLGNGSTGTITDCNIFPIQNSYIRFGTYPIFFGKTSPTNIEKEQTGRFDGGLEQVDIYDSTSVTANWASYPTKKVPNLYQLYVNPETRKISIATKGTFNLTLSLLELVGMEAFDKTVGDIKLAPKVDIGSNCSEITYTLNKIVDNVVTAIETNKDINLLRIPYGITSTVKAQELQYLVSGTLYSTDANNTPGHIDHFRIYTYPVGVESSKNYVEVNDSSPGSNIKYFSGYSNSVNHPFLLLPEVEQTTDLHRSFFTGVPVGGAWSNASFVLPNGSTVSSVNPYIKIPCDVLTVTDLTPKIYEVMFTARHVSGTASQVELLRTAETSPSHTITLGTPEPTGVQLYINGERYSSSATYNFSNWNHFCIKFTAGIAYNSNLFMGYAGASWVADNISVILTDLAPSRINYFYESYFGTIAERVPVGQSSSYMNFVLNDTETSDGTHIYQKLGNQTSFLSRSLCPRLSSTTNVAITYVSGNNWRLNYFGNRDLLKLDQVEMVLNDYILLKNQTTPSQNGIYQVSSVVYSGAPSQLHFVLTKQTALSDGTVVFVKEGWQNRSTYYLKSTVSSNQSFGQIITQKKYVAYNSDTANIEARVRYY
jgi:hypothetical protein